jgi:aspartate aminotransferase
MEPVSPPASVTAFRLPPRVQSLRPSDIFVLMRECRRRRAAGQRIVDLSVGEPDLATPEHVAVAAARAIDEGQTRYTTPAGMPPLRGAIARALGEEGLPYLVREVIATCGATGALSLALQALVGPGDEVVMAAPYYPDHRSQVVLAGGKPAIVTTTADDGFKLTPAALRSVLTPRSRVLLLNNPVNPTGVVYTPEELGALAEAALDANLFIIADEVYCNLVYDGPPFASVASLGPEVRRRSVIVRSLSKTYAMTGWRVGFAAGPQFLIDAMATVQGLSVVAPSTISQWAAVAALSGPRDAPRTFQSLLSRRWALTMDRLAALPGVTAAPSRGALFAFLDLGMADTRPFCSRLLSEHGVALVPGGEFGAPWGVRLSFAAAESDVRDGLDLIERALRAERAAS